MIEGATTVEVVVERRGGSRRGRSHNHQPLTCQHYSNPTTMGVPWAGLWQPYATPLCPYSTTRNSQHLNTLHH